MPNIEKLLNKWNQGTITYEELKQILVLISGENLECYNDMNLLRIIKENIDKQRTSLLNGEKKILPIKAKQGVLYSEDQNGEMFYFMKNKAKEEETKNDEIKKEVFRFEDSLPICIMNRDNQQVEFNYENKQVQVLKSTNNSGRLDYAKKETFNQYGNIIELSSFNIKESVMVDDYVESTVRILPDQLDRIEQTFIRSLGYTLNKSNMIKIITNKSFKPSITSLGYDDLASLLQIETQEERLEDSKYVQKNGIYYDTEYINDNDLSQAILEIQNEEVKKQYLEYMNNRKKEDFFNQQTK